MTEQNPNLQILTRTQVLGIMGITAVVLLVIAKVWQRLDSVSLLPVFWNVNHLALALAIAAGVTLGSHLIYRFWPRYRESADAYLKMVLSPLAWPDLIWLGILPGMSEELLFRGVMLSALGLNVTALVISSVLFGILHMGSIQQWPYSFWAAIVGGALGYSAIITGNLMVPIVAHTLTNFVAGCIWKSQHSSSV
ncbi:MAG: CPBP family intramembrane glutamic endopeptidase [Cyanobacteria bacterium P01_H01_bin.15]